MLEQLSALGLFVPGTPNTNVVSFEEEFFNLSQSGPPWQNVRVERLRSGGGLVQLA